MDNIGVTRAFETDQAYASLMSAGVTQNDGRGSYVYDNGTLTLAANTNLGYSVTMDTNQTLDPTDFAYLLANINSDVPFNITMDVTRADGTVASVELRKEFYPLFGGLAEVPEALPAGSWSPAMDLLGYYQWNGGATTSSIIRNITIELEGQGTLVLSDLQAARGIAPANINDGLGASGSYDNTYLITFVSNGGSEVASVSVRDGATVTKPTDPTRYGYTFAGWYCNPELTDPYDFSTPVPYSFKLYAKWKPPPRKFMTAAWPVTARSMPRASTFPTTTARISTSRPSPMPAMTTSSSGQALPIWVWIPSSRPITPPQERPDWTSVPISTLMP